MNRMYLALVLLAMSSAGSSTPVTAAKPISAALAVADTDSPDDGLATTGYYQLVDWTLPPNPLAGACSVPGTYATVALALADVGCDPINVGAGTFTENLTVDRSVTLDGQGPGTTILDGGAAGSVITVGTAGIVLVLSDLTIQNGSTAGNGGGINNWDVAGTVTLDNCTVTNNQADFGAGVANVGTLNIQGGATFLSNIATTSGGGVYNAGNLTVNGATFESNSANIGGGVYNEDTNGVGIAMITNADFTTNFTTVAAATDGGGLFNGGTATISATSSFTGNTADDDGGAIRNDQTLTVSDTDFSTNSANDLGGAIYSLGAGTVDVSDGSFLTNGARSGGGIFSFGVVILDRLLFSGNTAMDFGAGVNQQGVGTTITDTTFSGNMAATDGTGGGGGLSLVTAGTATIHRSTFESNTASQGGAINNQETDLNVNNSTLSGNNGSGIGDGILNITFNDTSTTIVNLVQVTVADNAGVGLRNEDQSGTLTAATTNLRNSIVANHTTADCVNLGGLASEVFDASAGYNLDTDATCITQVPGTGNATADPLLGPLQDNGGVTETRDPGDGPAINAVGVGSCPLSEDQRQVVRPQFGTCDVGAVESTTFPVELMSFSLE